MWFFNGDIPSNLHFIYLDSDFQSVNVQGKFILGHGFISEWQNVHSKSFLAKCVICQTSNPIFSALCLRLLLMVTSTGFLYSTANNSLVDFCQQMFYTTTSKCYFEEILCKNFMISSFEDFSLRFAPTLMFLLSFLKVRSPWVRTLPTRWFCSSAM